MATDAAVYESAITRRLSLLRFSWQVFCTIATLGVYTPSNDYKLDELKAVFRADPENRHRDMKEHEHHAARCLAGAGWDPYMAESYCHDLQKRATSAVEGATYSQAVELIRSYERGE
jgi:hypothetical protein